MPKIRLVKFIVTFQNYLQSVGNKMGVKSMVMIMWDAYVFMDSEIILLNKAFQTNL